MAGRNDAAIAAALEVVAQAVGQQPNANAGANVVVRMSSFEFARCVSRVATSEVCSGSISCDPER